MPKEIQDGLRRTMHYWLQRTTREIREQSNCTARDIALVAGLDPGTVSRWEKHDISWPRGHNIERLVVAYAQMCGVEDARDIWSEAIKQYQQSGGAPILGELTPQQRSLLLALEAAQRSAQDAGKSREAPTAKRRRAEDR